MMVDVIRGIVDVDHGCGERLYLMKNSKSPSPYVAHGDCCALMFVVFELQLLIEKHNRIYFFDFYNGLHTDTVTGDVVFR